MRLVFQKPKGQRIKYNFMGIQVHGLWWCPALDGWHTLAESRDKCENLYVSNVKQCRTYKAFRRFVRKNPQFRGKMILTSRWIGHNVTA